MEQTQDGRAELGAALALVTAAATASGDPARDMPVMAAAVAAMAELPDPGRALDALTYLGAVLAAEVGRVSGLPVGEVLARVGRSVAGPGPEVG